jgi:dihydroorotase
MTQQYDLLLKGGHICDPGRGLDAVADVAIKDKRIAAVQGNILSSTAAEVIDVRDRLIVPGLIDTHAHVYEHVTGRFGLNPDLVGVRSAVTTVVDQGGPSVMTFPGFRKFIVEPSATRVVAFLSAYVVGGLEGHYYPALYGPSGIDVEATVRVALANRDIVKGIKAHAEIGGFARWGVEAIRLSKEIGRQAKLPVYIHLGQLWALPKDGTAVDPDSILSQVVPLLEAGDILAHPFTRHPGGFVDKTGQVHPLVREALARGVKIDVGHGSHFSFKTARRVLAAGIMPDTLGADMHGYNTKVPAPAGSPGQHPDDENHPFLGAAQFSLTQAMTELLALGVPLARIVAMATTNAARMLGMDKEIGTLAPGTIADVSVLADERGRWRLVDNEKTEVLADRLLRPLFCLRAGRRFEATAEILPKAIAA